MNFCASPNLLTCQTACAAETHGKLCMQIAAKTEGCDTFVSFADGRRGWRGGNDKPRAPII